VLLILLPPIVTGQPTGKISGKIVAGSTQSALEGARIFLRGTSHEAVVDVAGDFTMLAVPAGSYDITASHGGYESVTLRGVRVWGGLTSQVQIMLPGRSDTLPTVEVVAGRSPVGRPATSTIRLIDQEWFDRFPLRGIDPAIALQPGIIEVSGSLHARGSRSDDMKYTLDGAPINDPINSGRAMGIIPESIEEVQLKMVGYTAEEGGTNGALVGMQRRTGSEQWRASFTFETDQYAPTGVPTLGGYTDNLANVIFTAGGPLAEEVRLFASGAYFYDGPGENSWAGPFNFGSFVTLMVRTPQHPTMWRSDTLELSGWGGGSRFGYRREWQSAGTLSLDLNPTLVRMGWTLNYLPWKNGLAFTDREINPHLTTEGYRQEALGTVKATQYLGDRTYLEFSANLQRTFSESYDPDFKGNLLLYGDSAANAARGVGMDYNGKFFGDYEIMLGGSARRSALGFPRYSPIGSGYQAGYGKSLASGYGMRFDVSSQVSKEVELKGGVEFETYSCRRYTPTNIFNWAYWNKRYRPDLSNYDDPNTQLFRAQLRVGTNNFGYDLLGNEIDNDLIVDDRNGTYMDSPGPLRPMTAGAYVQTEVELHDLVMTLGLRYDYFHTDTWDLANRSSIEYNDSLGIPSQGNFIKARALDYLEPRIGVAIPVAEGTVFHTTFGRFVQLLRLSEMVNAPTFLPYAWNSSIPQAVGFGMAPQRSVIYEIGFQHQLSDVVSLDITAFYKDIVGQPQYSMVSPAAGVPQGRYPLFVNTDFTTAKGIEIKCDLRRAGRLSASLTYTYSDVKATASGPSETASIWMYDTEGPYLPLYVMPATFNQAHSGNLVLGYSFGGGDGGPVLERMGLSLLLVFHSGENWTRVYSPTNNLADKKNNYPVEETGASVTPWGFRVDARLDKQIDIGPLTLDLYVRVRNLLNSFVPTGVKARTGDVFNDGYLQTPEGQAQAALYGADSQMWKTIYGYFNDTARAASIEPPRSVLLGLKLEL